MPMTDPSLKSIVRFWPVIIMLLSLAAAWGSIRADIAKVPDLETRITRVEDSQLHMKDDVSEIKQDVKRLLRR